jgi:trigger factor
MKISTKKLADSSVSMNIVMEEKDMKLARDEAIQHFSQTLKIPGFRKGHITETVVVQHIKEREIEEETKKKALQHAYSTSLKKEKLQPISEPNIQITKDSPLTFSITYEVKPHIDLGTYKEISIEIKAAKVEKKEIDKILKELQNQVPLFSKVQRSIKKGDKVIIDFEGFDLKNNPIPNTKAEKHSLEIGSQSFIPGFEEEIIGLKEKEEKTFEITFPKEYHSKEMAGNKYKFKIYIHSVEEKKLMDVNEDFVEKITGKKDSTESLIKTIELNLSEKKQADVKKEAEKKILTALSKKIKFELPKSLIIQEQRFIVDNIKMGGLERGLPWEKYLEQVKKTEEEILKEVENDAKKQVTHRLIIEEIIAKNKLKADEKIVEMSANQHLMRLKPEQQQKDKAFYLPGGKYYNQIKNMFLVNKAFDLFIKVKK